MKFRFRSKLKNVIDEVKRKKRLREQQQKKADFCKHDLKFVRITPTGNHAIMHCSKCGFDFKKPFQSVKK